LNLKSGRNNFTRIFANPWIPVTGIALVITLFLIQLIVTNRSQKLPADYSNYPKIELLRTAIFDVLNTFDLKPLTGIRKNGYEQIIVNVPEDLPIVNIHLALQERVLKIPAEILDARGNPISGKVRLSVGFEDSVYFTVFLNPQKEVKRNRGRIVLIIDDFGDRWDSFTRSFADLGIHLTVSILPGRKNSTLVARKFSGLGCETILHLPMEPIAGKFSKDEFMIFDNMSKSRILTIIQRALDQVPTAKGVNNHMGSKITQQNRIMTIVLEDLKRRGLYFVDSRTTAKTVAFDVAKKLNLKCTKRNVFLDTEPDEETIKKQLWSLAKQAEKRGYAVGIGHSRSLTLKVLKQEVEKIQAKGFSFVYVSEIL